jgi:hypothetical protein
MTKQEFSNWYSSFLEDYGGVVVDGNWFARYEANHKNLQKFLGGISKTETVEVQLQEVPKIPEQLLVPYVNDLYRLIRGYFSEYNIDYLSMAFPNVSNPKFKNMKWGKHISTWMERSDVPEQTKISVNKILSKMGELWANAKIEYGKFDVTITTDPRAFIRIGTYYNTDTGSCFRPGSSNQIHKYIIGQSKNTFVGFVTHPGYVLEFNKSIQPVSRFFGFANDDFDRFTLFNMYPNHHNVDPRHLKCTDIFFHKLLGESTTNFVERRAYVRNIYLNPKPIRTYFNKNNPITKKEILDCDVENLKEHKRCVSCVQAHPDIRTFDGQDYCPNCSRNAVQCDWSGEMTMRTFPARNYDNKNINVSNRFAEDFEVCQATDLHYPKDTFVETCAKHRVSSLSMTYHGAQKCASCNRFMFDCNSRRSISECPTCAKKVNKKKKQEFASI